MRDRNKAGEGAGVNAATQASTACATLSRRRYNAIKPMRDRNRAGEGAEVNAATQGSTAGATRTGAAFFDVGAAVLACLARCGRFFRSFPAGPPYQETGL
jgi:hypothetical protein